MRPIYVYNKIPVYGPKRRNKKGREYKTGTCFRLIHYYNSMCVIKPAGKGYHYTIEVRTCFLQISVPDTGFVDLNTASTYDLLTSMGV